MPESSQLIGSNLPLNESVSQQSNLRKSSRQIIPRRRFDIENEALMVLLGDDEKPRTVEETLSSLVRKEWKVALDKEMKSMRKNQV